MTPSALPPRTAPANSSPSTGGCPMRSNNSPENFPAAKMTASTTNRRTRSSGPAAAGAVSGTAASISARASPLGLGPVDDVVHQLLEGRLASVGFAGRLVLAVHREPRALPEHPPLALVEDLDVERDAHQTAGHLCVAGGLPGLKRGRDVGLVAHDRSAHHCVGGGLTRQPEP